MEPTSSLPFVVHVDGTDDPGDIVDALALEAFVSGAQPLARTRRLNRVRTDAPLAPGETEAARVARSPGRQVQLVRGPGWTLRASRGNTQTADVTVTATSDQLAGAILEQACAGAVEPDPPEDDALVLGFWHLGFRGGAHRSDRSITIAPWPAIRANYATLGGVRPGPAHGR